jgi:hypothetical protein
MDQILDCGSGGLVVTRINDRCNGPTAPNQDERVVSLLGRKRQDGRQQYAE